MNFFFKEFIYRNFTYFNEIYIQDVLVLTYIFCQLWEKFGFQSIMLNILNIIKKIKSANEGAKMQIFLSSCQLFEIRHHEAPFLPSAR